MPTRFSRVPALTTSQPTSVVSDPVAQKTVSVYG